MKTSVDLDDDLAAEVKRTADLTHENPATVLRMAIRAGLPIVANQAAAPRPEGYFAEMYRNWPKERLELEEGFSNEKVWPERPEE